MCCKRIVPESISRSLLDDICTALFSGERSSLYIISRLVKLEYQVKYSKGALQDSTRESRRNSTGPSFGLSVSLP